MKVIEVHKLPRSIETKIIASKDAPVSFKEFHRVSKRDAKIIYEWIYNCLPISTYNELKKLFMEG